MRGRKRSGHTKTERRKNDSGRKKMKRTPERLDHFKRLTGRDWTGAMDNADHSPLMVLQARGMLEGNIPAMVSAGHGYGALYWHQWGKPFGTVPFYGSMSGNGSISLPREVSDATDDERERLFRRRDGQLRRCGKGIRQRVVEVVVDFDLPFWFVRAVNGEMLHADYTARDELMTGLQALID